MVQSSIPQGIQRCFQNIPPPNFSQNVDVFNSFFISKVKSLEFSSENIRKQNVGILHHAFVFSEFGTGYCACAVHQFSVSPCPFSPLHF